MPALLIGALLWLPALPPDQPLAELHDRIDDIRGKYIKRVPIGSTVSEVKAALGKPLSIKAGFPDYGYDILPVIPDFIGQTDYSTWTYHEKLVTHTWKDTTGGGVEIDGYPVSKGLWTSYRELDTIWWEVREELFMVTLRGNDGSEREFQVIEESYNSVDVGDTVEPKVHVLNLFRLDALGKGGGLGTETVIKKHSRIDIGAVADPDHLPYPNKAKLKRDCIVKPIPLRHITKSTVFVPLVFVIFDKGTQAVASIKVLLVPG
jgi:hypothetical protein